ncbi:MAG: DNA polymerase [Phycisphaeraceae bacterium]|nr:DNA polymerase [Phycisphaeraceae bacterium]
MLGISIAEAFAMLRYLFVDMNSFFASVEQQDRPALRGRPVGIVPTLVATTCCIAASPEAKARGVRTGTGVRDALRLCPAIELIPARPNRYVQCHRRIVEAVESCLHVDQICSIDEMYGKLMGKERMPDQAVALAKQVKAAIRREAGEYLRCSIGLATNVWLAKVASDMHKPDGLTVMLAEQLPDALTHLKLTDLPGIATNMQRRLHQHGIHDVRRLCGLSKDELSAIWGSAVHGSIWWHQLRGRDLPFRATHRRTVGHSHVLPPVWRTKAGAKAVMVRMLHKAAARLRRIHYWARHLTLIIDFLQAPPWQRRVPLGLSQDTLTMVQALEQGWRDYPAFGQVVPLRVGVVLTDLVADEYAPLPLYPDQTRRDTLASAMDRLDRKYGRHTLYFAGMFGAKQTAPTRISFTQIPDVNEMNDDNDD